MFPPEREWAGTRSGLLGQGGMGEVYLAHDTPSHDTGTPVIIEANNNTGVDLFQVHYGVLRDARVRRFYEACNVL